MAEKGVLGGLQQLMTMRNMSLQGQTMQENLDALTDVREAAQAAYTAPNAEQGLVGGFDKEGFQSALKAKGRITEALEYQKKFAETEYEEAKAKADTALIHIDRFRRGIQLYQAGDKNAAIMELNTGRPPEEKIADIIPNPRDNMKVTAVRGDGTTAEINIEQLNRGLTSSEVQFTTDAAAARVKADKPLTQPQIEGQILLRMINNELRGQDRFSGFSTTEVQLARPLTDAFNLTETVKAFMNNPEYFRHIKDAPYETIGAIINNMHAAGEAQYGKELAKRQLAAKLGGVPATGANTVAKDKQGRIAHKIMINGKAEWFYEDGTKYGK